MSLTACFTKKKTLSNRQEWDGFRRVVYILDAKRLGELRVDRKAKTEIPADTRHLEPALPPLTPETRHPKPAKKSCPPLSKLVQFYPTDTLALHRYRQGAVAGFPGDG